MRNARLKIIAAATLLTIGVTLLTIAGVRDGWVYFLPVDQFLESETYHTQRVRLHGVVGEENFQERRGMLTASFDLLGKNASIRVEYSGVIPEMFAPARDVVVEGRMNEAGLFEADTLMTKCASKYESGEGEAPHADPRRNEVR
jgi:cytochrome c-type biogenesis protein CcmE